MRTDLVTPQNLPNPTTSMPGSAGAAETEELTLSFDGFTYKCRILHGSAPRTAPLLLLGGSSQNRHAWVRHEQWLSPLCTMITVDLPGYGEADFLPERYGIDFLAATVRHMLDETGFTEVNLLGACFGGAIAMRFCQHYPQYVLRLALGGITTSVPHDYAQAVPIWLEMLERGELAESATALVDKFMAPKDRPIRKRSAVARLLYRQFMNQSPVDIAMMVEHNARLLRHEWYRAEPLPALPSLVFTGEYDALTPPWMGREVASTLPTARFVTIQESDHLVHVERMEEFADLMGRFFTDQVLDGLPYCNTVESTGATIPRHR